MLLIIKNSCEISLTHHRGFQWVFGVYLQYPFCRHVCWWCAWEKQFDTGLSWPQSTTATIVLMTLGKVHTLYCVRCSQEGRDTAQTACRYQSDILKMIFDAFIFLPRHCGGLQCAHKSNTCYCLFRKQWCKQKHIERQKRYMRYKMISFKAPGCTFFHTTTL